MKYIYIKGILISLLFFSSKQYAQHHSKMTVVLDNETKTLNIQQIITYFNLSQDTLNSIVLNDWNQSYSGKNTPLGRRFSNEFNRSFLFADQDERGRTSILSMTDANTLNVKWERIDKAPDLIKLQLNNPIYPNHRFDIQIVYTVKLPNNRFTKYGYDNDGSFYLKNWYLTPARYESNQFIKYSNENLDDIANAASDFDISFSISENMKLNTDLNSISIPTDSSFVYNLEGKNRIDFSLVIQSVNTFKIYKNELIEVVSDLKSGKTEDSVKIAIIDKITRFVNENIGKYPYEKITVTQTDYERNPFYGLNQLPSFMSPFQDDFLFEVQFLKTYLNNYLKTSLLLDPRKDNWIYDGIQVYTMMKYIDHFYPESKMMGNISNWKLLKGYHITDIDFNEQYNYMYMLMVRKNLDQPIGNPKNTFIKFNEQIAGKYKAGLSFKYLDNYLENDIVPISIRKFYTLNQHGQTTRKNFESIIRSSTNKDLNWFFYDVIDSRNIVDYKFKKIVKTKDSITITIKNKASSSTVPISLYGIKKDTVIFKKWYDNITTDSTFIINRNQIDKIVLNYHNEIPEYNLRNNSRNLNGFRFTNRPIKFNFLKDIEDPDYNQIFYVPAIVYNLYDGISPAIRLHNKSMLDKPFLFDIKPTYSTKTNSLTGSASFIINQNIRNGSLYNIKYLINGTYYHYAPDAAYLKFAPTVQFRIRDENFRDNKKELIQLRHVIVNRDKSSVITDEKNQNYSVFNAKYINNQTEITQHFNLTTDLQIANSFGKIAAEIEYRKLFNNRQISLRLFAGNFLYRNMISDYFSFALDRPTDYMFDYNYYGRSENTGLFSQQLILAEGGFKSKLNTPYANQWITTINTGFTVWNWIEVYGDAGFIKNRTLNKKFVYDSGIRLNLVPDFFELYLPISSNNGWEIAQPHYNEKIRFIITLSPKVLVNLFTRKWL